MGLVLSSLCLGIDLCMINLSIAPGHVHPKQWRAASTSDACCTPPRIIDYKRENQISHFVLQKGPSEREFLRKKSSKMHASVIFCNVALGFVKSLSSLRACLCVFELCGFCGGVLGKGPGDELHHHQVQRDDNYGRRLEARLSVCLPDPGPDSCRLRGLQPKIRVRNQPSV